MRGQARRLLVAFGLQAAGVAVVVGELGSEGSVCKTSDQVTQSNDFGALFTDGSNEACGHDLQCVLSIQLRQHLTGNSAKSVGMQKMQTEFSKIYANNSKKVLEGIFKCCKIHDQGCSDRQYNFGVMMEEMTKLRDAEEKATDGEEDVAAKLEQLKQSVAESIKNVLSTTTDKDNTDFIRAVEKRENDGGKETGPTSTNPVVAETAQETNVVVQRHGVTQTSAASTVSTGASTGEPTVTEAATGLPKAQAAAENTVEGEPVTEAATGLPKAQAAAENTVEGEPAGYYWQQSEDRRAKGAKTSVAPARMWLRKINGEDQMEFKFGTTEKISAGGWVFLQIPFDDAKNNTDASTDPSSWSAILNGSGAGLKTLHQERLLVLIIASDMEPGEQTIIVKGFRRQTKSSSEGEFFLFTHSQDVAVERFLINLIDTIDTPESEVVNERVHVVSKKEEYNFVVKNKNRMNTGDSISITFPQQYVLKSDYPLAAQSITIKDGDGKLMGGLLTNTIENNEVTIILGAEIDNLSIGTIVVPNIDNPAKSIETDAFKITVKTKNLFPGNEDWAFETLAPGVKIYDQLRFDAAYSDAWMLKGAPQGSNIVVNMGKMSGGKIKIHVTLKNSKCKFNKIATRECGAVECLTGNSKYKYDIETTDTEAIISAEGSDAGENLRLQLSLPSCEPGNLSVTMTRWADKNDSQPQLGFGEASVSNVSKRSDFKAEATFTDDAFHLSVGDVKALSGHPRRQIVFVLHFAKKWNVQNVRLGYTSPQNVEFEVQKKGEKVTLIQKIKDENEERGEQFGRIFQIKLDRLQLTQGDDPSDGGVKVEVRSVDTEQCKKYRHDATEEESNVFIPDALVQDATLARKPGGIQFAAQYIPSIDPAMGSMGSLTLTSTLVGVAAEKRFNILLHFPDGYELSDKTKIQYSSRDFSFRIIDKRVATLTLQKPEGSQNQIDGTKLVMKLENVSRPRNVDSSDENKMEITYTTEATPKEETRAANVVEDFGNYLTVGTVNSLSSQETGNADGQFPEIVAYGAFAIKTVKAFTCKVEMENFPVGAQTNAKDILTPSGDKICSQGGDLASHEKCEIKCDKDMKMVKEQNIFQKEAPEYAMFMFCTPNGIIMNAGGCRLDLSKEGEDSGSEQITTQRLQKEDFEKKNSPSLCIHTIKWIKLPPVDVVDEESCREACLKIPECLATRWDRGATKCWYTPFYLGYCKTTGENEDKFRDGEIEGKLNDSFVELEKSKLQSKKFKPREEYQRNNIKGQEAQRNSYVSDFANQLFYALNSDDVYRQTLPKWGILRGTGGMGSKQFGKNLLELINDGLILRRSWQASMNAILMGPIILQAGHEFNARKKLAEAYDAAQHSTYQPNKVDTKNKKKTTEATYQPNKVDTKIKTEVQDPRNEAVKLNTLIVRRILNQGTSWTATNYASKRKLERHTRVEGAHTKVYYNLVRHLLVELEMQTENDVRIFWTATKEARQFDNHGGFPHMAVQQLVLPHKRENMRMRRHFQLSCEAKESLRSKWRGARADKRWYSTTASWFGKKITGKRNHQKDFRSAIDTTKEATKPVPACAEYFQTNLESHVKATDMLLATSAKWSVRKTNDGSEELRKTLGLTDIKDLIEMPIDDYQALNVISRTRTTTAPRLLEVIASLNGDSTSVLLKDFTKALAHKREVWAGHAKAASEDNALGAFKRLIIDPTVTYFNSFTWKMGTKFWDKESRYCALADCKVDEPITYIDNRGSINNININNDNININNNNININNNNINIINAPPASFEPPPQPAAPDMEANQSIMNQGRGDRASPF